MANPKQKKSPSFFSLFVQERLHNLSDNSASSKLLKLNQLINWNRIDYKLKKINKNQRDGKTVGTIPYNPLKMFKAILLQQ